MDWFLALLAFTTIVRGVGAGIIYDVAVVSLSVRHDIGAVPYARYARALLAGRGATTFAPVALGGALLSIAAAAGAFVWTDSAGVRWWTCIALAATVLAFAGTTQALPAVMTLRHTADERDRARPGPGPVRPLAHHQHRLAGGLVHRLGRGAWLLPDDVNLARGGRAPGVDGQRQGLRH